MQRSKAKQKGSDAEDSDSSNDSSSDEEEKSKAKKKKAKAKAKKKKAAEAAEAEEDASEEDPVKTQLAQLQALQAQLTGKIPPIRRRGTIIDGTVEKTEKTKTKKKKVDPNHPDYFRVDQLWDNTIHNYKLTETADKADEEDFGEPNHPTVSCCAR
jgi:hypothetical protein